MRKLTPKEVRGGWLEEMTRIAAANICLLELKGWLTEAELSDQDEENKLEI